MYDNQATNMKQRWINSDKKKSIQLCDTQRETGHRLRGLLNTRMQHTCALAAEKSKINKPL